MEELPRLVLLTASDEGALPGLESIAEEVNLIQVRDEDALREQLPEADILLVTDFRTEMLRRAWPQRHRISWVHATSAGVDMLMFPELVKSDVQVTNARGVFDRGIAEYVLGAVLLFAKDSMNNLRFQRQHEWRHRETELIRGKTALIVGAGSIGREVAGLLGAAGMRVIGTARHAREDENFAAVYTGARLPELLPDADYVVITAPLTGETRGLFDREAFGRMKPSARLINIGRGPIVNEGDLVRALEDGLIAGAALDVFEQEPLDAQSPLWDLPQVMISAHMAGDFAGWRRALGEQFVENFRRWRKGQPLRNIVDKRKGYIGSE
ncbi:MAG: D-2-hydroxyacid dehydrogenase [Gammaproteobacteria bacterium]|jgi:phosphoglycerate dehydrogenase-like enzyme